MQKVLSQNIGNTAAGATDSVVIGKAPFDGTVTAVTYTPEAAMTGHASDKRVFTIVNKGADGTGTDVVATLDMTGGVSAAAFDEKAFTLSGTAANLAVEAGDVLAFVSTHAGSGIADPGGEVSITIERGIA